MFENGRSFCDQIDATRNFFNIMISVSLGRISRKSSIKTTFRCMGSMVTTKKEDGVAWIHMNSPPVNTMNKAFMKELVSEIKSANDDKSLSSLVLVSDAKVYSAGLDLNSMYSATDEELTEFWETVREMWITLYSSRLATICAIEGPSPAGGCLLAIASDARIMSSNGVIGLNEAAFGLIVPMWGMKAMIDVMGRRNGEKACLLGTLYSADQALSLGLIDTLVASPDEVRTQAAAEAKRWGKVPGRQGSKLELRKEFVEWYHATAAEDIKSFKALVSHPRTQAALGAYLESLKKRKN
jgi:Delta3-Delta2-enoyl-CoA isomerase